MLDHFYGRTVELVSNFILITIHFSVYRYDLYHLMSFRRNSSNNFNVELSYSVFNLDYVRTRLNRFGSLVIWN